MTQEQADTITELLRNLFFFKSGFQATIFEPVEGYCTITVILNGGEFIIKNVASAADLIARVR